jgi:predicted amidophosphoribosyltransferase
MEIDPMFLLVVAMVVVGVVLVFSKSRNLGPDLRRTCRDCGAAHPSFAKFCRRCGKRL